MKTFFKYTAFLILGLVANQLFAQNQITTLPLVRTLPQASYLNPGMLPDYKFAMSLPGLSGMYTTTDINFTNLNTIQTADPQKVYDKLARTNRLTNYQEISIFHFGIRTQKSHTAFSVNSRVFSRLTVPRDMLGVLLLGNGNENFSNRDISLNDFSFVSRAYTEFGITHGREILPNLNVGVRLKYLQGHYDVSLNQLDARFINRGTDGLGFETNEFDFNVAGVADLIDGNDFDPMSLAMNRNSGFGIDIGAEYRFLDRFNFFASIVDIGSINWTQNTATYRVPTNSLIFEGVTDIFNANEDGAFGGYDSTLRAFEPIRLDGELSYRSFLNAKFYGGASFDLTQDHTFGTLLFSEFYQGKIIPAFSFYYNTRYKTVFDLVVNTTVMNNRVDNVGLGFTAKFFIFQFFAVTNSVFSYTNPLSAQSLSLRFGVNINAGNIKKQNKRASKSGDSIMLDI